MVGVWYLIWYLILEFEISIQYIMYIVHIVYQNSAQPGWLAGTQDLLAGISAIHSEPYRGCRGGNSAYNGFHGKAFAPVSCFPICL